MLQKVAYLNEDDKWITPIYLSQRTSAEQIAAMQKQVVEVMAERLDVLAPLYAFCEERGYSPEGEAIRVGDWPDQLIPAFSPLTEEAIAQAETADLEGVPLRVVRADDLACIALGVGRAQDHARVLALRESGAVADEAIEDLAARHGLTAQWRAFKERFGEG